MPNTPNINLAKPQGTDSYLIDIFNANMDKIDANALNQVHFKGVLNLITNLPSTGQITGDAYFVSEDGLFRVWSGSDWVKQTKTVVDAQVLGTILAGANTKSTPVDADLVGYSDTADGNKLKKMTFTNFKAFLKTYFDGIYNNYVHPTTDGNKHVPATGTTNNGKVLMAGSTAGSMSWADVDVGTPVASEVGVTPVGGISATEVQSALAELDTEKAPKVSPEFTGTPTAPTQAVLDDSTKLVTTAMLQARAKILPYTEMYASATLDLSKAGRFVLVTSASAVNITVPPDSTTLFPDGTSITFFKHGAGAVSFVQGAGVTIMSVGSKKNIANTYETVTLYKVGIANAWVLIGALA